MKILNSRIHGIVDYIVVLFLWLSPTLFGLSPFISILVYALGGVHLGLTVLTNFPFGLVKVIPLKIHGLIELVVGVVLIASPLVLGGMDGVVSAVDHYFFAGFGVAVLATWFVSDYSN